MGIEPNEHQISRFQGKYSYHTDHPENPESPHPAKDRFSGFVWNRVDSFAYRFRFVDVQDGSDN